MQKICLPKEKKILSANKIELFNSKYDFIFLDGDHASNIVFQEIKNSFKILSNKSNILLHDFYPNYRNIYQNSFFIPGPFTAYLKIKNIEWNDYSRSLTQWEKDFTLDC